MSMYLPGGTTQKGGAVKEELVVLLMAAAEFEMTDLLGIVDGMKAPDARKAVRILKVISFRAVFNP